MYRVIFYIRRFLDGCCTRTVRIGELKISGHEIKIGQFLLSKFQSLRLPEKNIWLHGSCLQVSMSSQLS
jgi:hypothetical protein